MASQLKSGSIGLLGATTLGVVMLSPAMTIYGGFGPAYLAAGHTAPLAFVWALLATLPTVVSYIVLSGAHPSSGSAAAWAEKAFNKSFSFWAAWIVFLYYLTNFIIQPVTLGVFAGDFFKLLGSSPGIASYLVGVLLGLLVAATLVYRGISISTKAAVTFLVLETAVVVLLCGSILWAAKEKGMALDLKGFSLANSATGASGVFRAMVFAILAYCGFDVVSTLAEETHLPEKLIPRATFLSLVVYALVIIGAMWVLTFGADPLRLKAFAEGGQMPITEVAQLIWGKGAIWVSLTGITAALGLSVATAVGASRVLYSMARSGQGPKFFSVLGAQQIPARSLHVIFGLGFAASIVTGVLVGPYNSYVWWGTTSTYFALVTYLVVNAASMVLHSKVILSNAKSFALYLLIPLIGLLTEGYLLYRTFFAELWVQDWLTGKSVVIFDLFCSIIPILFLTFRAITKRPGAGLGG